jgi:hypothetical protein
MGGKFPVDIPPISNYIPGISDQFPLSSFAVCRCRPAETAHCELGEVDSAISRGEF